MDFSFSKSQQMLKKSARDFLKKGCKELAREAEEMPEGFSPKSWKKIADLGWLGIGIPEEYGGIGGDFFDHAIVLQEMGNFLFPGPYIASTICSSSLIHEFGSDIQKEALLTQMTDGETIVIPTLIAPEPFAGESQKDTLRIENDGSFIFTGTRLFVPYALSADYFLILVDSIPDDTV